MADEQVINAYANADDLRGRLGEKIFEEIYYHRTSPAARNDLKAAAAEIDGSISARYVLPVASERSLALLQDWCLTLAEERAYSRAAGSEFAEKIKERAAQVRRMLELIRNGGFRLPDAVEIGSGGGSGASFTLVQSDEPVFTRERLKGF